MKLHIIVHESFEAPAAIENWAREKGHEVEFTRLHDGDQLPENTDDFDFLVVMGGPQSPATSKDECPHFDSQAEQSLILKAIENDKYVFGVCLGAQLIGEALGAKFDHSPNREIGVFNITLTAEGQNDPNFQGFEEQFLVGHWHGDMPGLTENAKVLAFSEGCPRQIVRYTPKVYGFQCHFEFTPPAIEAMIQNSTAELEEHQDLPFVETPTQLRSHDYSPINQLLFSFLDNFTA